LALIRTPEINPAAQLLAWGILLAALVAVPWPSVLLIACLVLAMALSYARILMLSLLRRTRWLLLAVLVLFGWLTPGMPVTGLPGATADGLQQGIEQLSRLSVSLAMVAILLRRMPTERLLAACHGLLMPLKYLQVNIDRFILRLALTLRRIDSPGACVPSSIVLRVPPWRGLDVLFVVLVALLARLLP
jgi:energy-coupling factor transport system permease protein